MQEVYITGIGTFLPNNPISNNEIEEYLGKINGQESRAKKRVLDQNGIQKRYYALDKIQKSTHSNAQLAANSLQEALSKSGLEKGRLFKANSTLMVCIGATIGKTGFSETPISSNQQNFAICEEHPTQDDR